MRYLAAFCLLLVCAFAVVGPSSGAALRIGGAPELSWVTASDRENPCPGSVPLEQHDGSFESAYAWTGGGVVPPDYGSWVERFEAVGWACGLRLHLTITYEHSNQILDAYLYAEENGLPGTVLSATVGVMIDTPGVWPEITAHDLGIYEAEVNGAFYLGFWGNWPGGDAKWYIASDENGPGPGRPMTRIAPGIGYPTGWQDVTVVWPDAEALGIGAYVTDENPTPTASGTWGSVKSLYR